MNKITELWVVETLFESIFIIIMAYIMYKTWTIK
jgi:hypothetical protein